MNLLNTYFRKMEDIEKRPSLLINALSNWMALGIAVIVGFLLTPYIIKHLGKTGYGIWTLISSIIGYYGILDIGVSSAITRYVAHYAGQKNYKALNETISTSFAMFCVVGLIAVATSFVVAEPLSNFFSVPSDQVEKFRQTVWLLGLSAALGFPGNLFGAVIRAHERFVAANCVNIAITVVRASLILLFLANGIGLLGIAYSYVATSILMIILNFALCKLLLSHVKVQVSMVHWSVMRLLLAFGVSTTILQIADIMRFNLDSFVIGKWVGLNSVAVFAVAALLVRYMLEFVATGTQQVFTPRFASLDSNGERVHLQQLFLKSLSVASFLSFGVGTLIMIFGKQFIILWVGQEFTDAAPVLSILCVVYSVALAQNTGLSAMYALKKHHFFALVSVAEGIANVVLSIYLAKRLGIIGVALGTAIPMFVVKLFIQPIYVSRIVGISLICYWRQLVPALSLGIVAIMVEQHIPQITFLGNGYISIVFCSMPYVAAFALLYLLFDKITTGRGIQEELKHPLF